VGDGVPRMDPAPPVDDWPHLEELFRWRVVRSTALRYARVSGDFNPIHLGVLPARLLGLDRPVLHGQCAEAMIWRVVVAHRLGGDMTRLRRSRIRFTAPIPLPSEVVLQVEPGYGVRRFRLTPARPGSRDFAEGDFLLAPPPEGQG